jgi:hypothetical protein
MIARLILAIVAPTVAGSVRRWIFRPGGLGFIPRWRRFRHARLSYRVFIGNPIRHTFSAQIRREGSFQIFLDILVKI